LGPLGTAAINMPIVQAQDDYDNGIICEIVGRGNRSIRRKPTPNAAVSTTKSHILPGRESRPPRWEASD
jgi:hypothetical protein